MTDLTGQKLVVMIFSSVINIKLFKNLAKVVNVVLTLSHEQTSAEMGFSINKSILETNMKEKSIGVKKLI